MSKKSVLGRGMASLIAHNVSVPASDSEKNKIVGKLARDKKLKDEAISSSIDNNSQMELDKSEFIYTQSTIHYISPNLIEPNPSQPRKIFNDEHLQELAQSIEENGILQPLVVSQGEQNQIILIAGERRLRASKMIGLKEVPVIFRTVTDRERSILAIIENIQRADLNCVEEAMSYFHLMDEYKLTQEEVAKKLGKERSSVANYLRLLKLPRIILDYLKNQELSFGHGKVLASIKDRDLAMSLADLCVQNQWTVRDLEKAIKKRDEGNQSDEISLLDSKGAKEKERKKLEEHFKYFQEKLEKRTGKNFKIHAKNEERGEIVLQFDNKAQFNDWYEFLMHR